MDTISTKDILRDCVEDKCKQKDSESSRKELELSARAQVLITDITDNSFRS